MADKRKGWLRILAFIIPYILIAGAFQLAGVALAGFDPLAFKPGMPTTPEEDLLIYTFTLAGTFFVIWLFTRFVDKKPFVSVGFQTKNRLKDFIFGLVLAAGLIGTGFGIMLFTGALTIETVVFDPLKLFMSVLVFLNIAFLEEVLVRGYVLRNLMDSFNKYAALIVSALLFSIMHGLNPDFGWIPSVNLFLAGILLGITYIHTRNLWFPIALHFSWNFVQTHLGFNVSGQQHYSILETSISDANLMNGGAFGFEGSVIAIIAHIAAIIALGVYYHRQSKNDKTYYQTAV